MVKEALTAASANSIKRKRPAWLCEKTWRGAKKVRGTEGHSLVFGYTLDSWIFVKHPARSFDTINVASGMPSSHCLGSAGSEACLAESRLRRKCISELQSRGDTGRFSLEQKLPRCCLRRPARPKRRSVCLYGLLYNSGRRNERFRGKVRTAAFKSTQKQTADVVVHYR
jgi:hypothetical protein